MLTIADHEAIRAAIDARVNEEDLPDRVIAASVFREAAVAEIKRADPDWATRADDELAALRRAAIYTCAALLVTSTPVWANETIGNWSGGRKVVDPVAKAVELRQRAAVELAVVVGDTTPDVLPRPTFFRAGRGRRYRQDVC